MENANSDCGRWKTHILLSDLTYYDLRFKFAFCRFIQKHLTSTRAGNWRQAVNLIKSIREGGDLGTVFVELTQTCLLQCAHDGYPAAWQQIVREVQAASGAVFVHEHNLQGMWTAWTDRRYPVTARAMRIGAEVIANLQVTGIKVLPYKKRSDLILAIEKYLDKLDGKTHET